MEGRKNASPGARWDSFHEHLGLSLPNGQPLWKDSQFRLWKLYNSANSVFSSSPNCHSFSYLPVIIISIQSSKVRRPIHRATSMIHPLNNLFPPNA